LKTKINGIVQSRKLFIADSGFLIRSTMFTIFAKLLNKTELTLVKHSNSRKNERGGIRDDIGEFNLNCHQ